MDTVGTRENYLKVRRTEFRHHLQTEGTGNRWRIGLSHNHDIPIIPLPGGVGRENCSTFGADGTAITRVLNIAAGEYLLTGGYYGRTDLEVRIGGICVVSGVYRKVKGLLQCSVVTVH